MLSTMSLNKKLLVPKFSGAQNIYAVSGHTLSEPISEDNKTRLNRATYKDLRAKYPTG